MAIKDVFAEVEQLKANLENLSVDKLKEEMAANPDLLLIDIREIQELVDLGTIPGAVHVARGMMEFWASPASPYYRDYFQEERYFANEHMDVRRDYEQQDYRANDLNGVGPGVGSSFWDSLQVHPCKPGRQHPCWRRS